MNLINFSWANLLLLVCITLQRGQPGSTQGLCDPISGRLIDSNTNKALLDVCPTNEFCKENPGTSPSKGSCSPKVPPGSPCRTNAECLRGTPIEGNKFICSKKPGNSEGVCGCLLDYMTQAEKDERELEYGFTWVKVTGDEGGCIKSVLSRKPCNPRTDECTDAALQCRPYNGQSGASFCLYPFKSRNAEDKCYDNSDCNEPFSCEKDATTGGYKCACKPGFKQDPNAANSCVSIYVHYMIQCTSHEDCLLAYNIECNAVDKVCKCLDAPPAIYEFFPQANDQERCYQTRIHGEACVYNAILTEHGTDHDCRRRSKDGRVTNLFCQDGTCDCEPTHFQYDNQEGVCKQLHAWFGEPCSSDSGGISTDHPLYQCDVGLHLTCEDYKCRCAAGARILPNKKKACQLTVKNVGIGEKCNNESLNCDADLHLGCQNGTCDCVVDAAVTKQGQYCKFKHDSRVKACASLQFVLKSLAVLPVLLSITNYWKNRIWNEEGYFS